MAMTVDSGCYCGKGGNAVATWHGQVQRWDGTLMRMVVVEHRENGNIHTNEVRYRANDGSGGHVRYERWIR